MLGLCFESIERVAVRRLDQPAIQSDHDAIVRVEMAGLCGSDLHPYFGREKGIDVGTVMGHEFVGEVVAVGTAVDSISVGQRVCAPFTTSCGHCELCHKGLTSRCPSGELFGWREGGIGLHGGQAEFVRVPCASGTLMPIPAGVSDETAILLGDNLSTAFFAADLAGAGESDVAVVIGCGTVGLLTVLAASRRGATTIVAVDPNPDRAAMAGRLGAIATSDEEEAVSRVADLTGGRGADAVMELVGLPAAQRLAYRVIGAGGTMSVIGCHCTPGFAFSPSDAYDKNLTYRTGRCPARAYMSRLTSDDEGVLPIDLSWCVTHRFPIDQAVEAYGTFAHGRDHCVKAVLTF